ncbi:hypothetical protein M9Y10_029508 [Tritrichomonas musculus]|uniref:Uncharacterized protein n=1 Tax=Tritrichomonas musculus TaxID=1915356 RepID=A0ABR2KMA8_9EUKA
MSSNNNDNSNHSDQKNQKNDRFKAFENLIQQIAKEELYSLNNQSESISNGNDVDIQDDQDKARPSFGSDDSQDGQVDDQKEINISISGPHVFDIESSDAISDGSYFNSDSSAFRNRLIQDEDSLNKDEPEPVKIFEKQDSISNRSLNQSEKRPEDMVNDIANVPNEDKFTIGERPFVALGQNDDVIKKENPEKTDIIDKIEIQPNKEIIVKRKNDDREFHIGGRPHVDINEHDNNESNPLNIPEIEPNNIKERDLFQEEAKTKEPSNKEGETKSESKSEKEEEDAFKQIVTLPNGEIIATTKDGLELFIGGRPHVDINEHDNNDNESHDIPEINYTNIKERSVLHPTIDKGDEFKYSSGSDFSFGSTESEDSKEEPFDEKENQIEYLKKITPKLSSKIVKNAVPVDNQELNAKQQTTPSRGRKSADEFSESPILNYNQSPIKKAGVVTSPGLDFSFGSVESESIKEEPFDEHKEADQYLKKVTPKLSEKILKNAKDGFPIDNQEQNTELQATPGRDRKNIDDLNETPKQKLNNKEKEEEQKELTNSTKESVKPGKEQDNIANQSHASINSPLSNFSIGSIESESFREGEEPFDEREELNQYLKKVTPKLSGKIMKNAKDGPPIINQEQNAELQATPGRDRKNIDNLNETPKQQLNNKEEEKQGEITNPAETIEIATPSNKEEEEKVENPVILEEEEDQEQIENLIDHNEIIPSEESANTEEEQGEITNPAETIEIATPSNKEEEEKVENPVILEEEEGQEQIENSIDHNEIIPSEESANTEEEEEQEEVEITVEPKEFVNIEDEEAESSEESQEMFHDNNITGNDDTNAYPSISDEIIFLEQNEPSLAQNAENKENLRDVLVKLKQNRCKPAKQTNQNQVVKSRSSLISVINNVVDKLDYVVKGASCAAFAYFVSNMF